MIDLSHRAKWDVQDADLSQVQPWGVTVPETPGGCVLQNGLLINRMNRTQVACWHLAGDNPDIPEETSYTETTDASVLLALVGKEAFSIMEKLSSLDFSSPEKRPPCLFQGPVIHVPCQVVSLGESGGLSAVLISCSRGYAHSMVEGLLDAGAEWKLCPAGENAFGKWLEGSSIMPGT